MYGALGGWLVMMLGKLQSAVKREKDILQIRLPRHIAITTDGTEKWALKNEVSYEEAYKKGFFILKSTINTQVNLRIPVLTFYILDKEYDKESDSYNALLTAVVNMLDELSGSSIIHENKVKISVLGKWYNLPGRVVDSIKRVIGATKGYDGFFVNFCINYSGQEEIVNAARILGMQIKSGKLDPELIDKESIKENLYTSFLLPPNLMIKNGSKKETTGFLLWDCVNAKLCFTNRLWPDFDRAELIDAIREYQKGD
jgi:undecaprenyl diphosphate synthase